MVLKRGASAVRVSGVKAIILSIMKNNIFPMNNIQGIDREKLEIAITGLYAEDKMESAAAIRAIIACLASIEPERCTKCDGTFLHHHHKHVTRGGVYHTKCYRKCLLPMNPDDKKWCDCGDAYDKDGYCIGCDKSQLIASLA